MMLPESISLIFQDSPLQPLALKLIFKQSFSISRLLIFT